MKVILYFLAALALTLLLVEFFALGGIEYYSLLGAGSVGGVVIIAAALRALLGRDKNYYGDENE